MLTVELRYTHICHVSLLFLDMIRPRSVAQEKEERESEKREQEQQRKQREEREREEELKRIHDMEEEG